MKVFWGQFGFMDGFEMQPVNNMSVRIKNGHVMTATMTCGVAFGKGRINSNFPIFPPL